MSRAQQFAAAACALALAALLVPGRASAEEPIAIHPDEFFVKACSGSQIGVALTTGATYRCVEGLWTRSDIPACLPDPPDGKCSGGPICQSAADANLYFCVDGRWTAIQAAAGDDCADCAIAPSSATDRALVRFDGSTGRTLADSSAILTDEGALSLARPLTIESGGTGASTPAGARMAIEAASDAAVVHLQGDETIHGEKSFLGAVRSAQIDGARINGVRHSELFPSVADALADLPASGGSLQVDAGEVDPTRFADLNPASPTSGRVGSLSLDFRRGGARFLSSMPEYPSGAAGALEERVPFVFQVRLDDPEALTDAGVGAIGEWNCGRVGAGSVSCPIGNSSFGSGGGSRQYWYSGQCNTRSDSRIGASAICGGPHILEVRYPEQPGSHESKPIFAVGNGGAALFAPDDRGPEWRSFLTMFRGDDGFGETDKANTPMYTFDRFGASFDGGLFVGNALHFPEYTPNYYDPFVAWFAHDIWFDKPALVVEGPVDTSPEAQMAPFAKFYDRSGRGTHAHPGNAREAFGFYNHSRLYLGSFRDDLVPDRGQLIEWEGTTVDTNTTRLRVEEPTASRDVYLPDRTGTVVVAPHTPDSGPLLWGVAGKTGTEVCAGSGLSCEATAALAGSGGVKSCSQIHQTYFSALCFARR